MTMLLTIVMYSIVVDVFNLHFTSKSFVFESLTQTVIKLAVH